jgi:hypothetical protein
MSFLQVLITQGGHEFYASIVQGGHEFSASTHLE